MYRVTRTQPNHSDKEENASRVQRQLSFVANILVTRMVSDSSYECDVLITDVVSGTDTQTTNKTVTPGAEASTRFSDCYQHMSGPHKVILNASGQLTIVSISEMFTECLNRAYSEAYSGVGMKFDVDIIASMVNSILPELPNEPVVLGHTWSSAQSLPYTVATMHLNRHYALEAIDVDNLHITVNGSGSVEKPSRFVEEWINAFIVSGNATFDARRKLLTKAQLKHVSQTTFRNTQGNLRQVQGVTIFDLELLSP